MFQSLFCGGKLGWIRFLVNRALYASTSSLQAEKLKNSILSFLLHSVWSVSSMPSVKRRKGHRVTKSLQGCKIDIMPLCKSDFQTIPAVAQEDKRGYKDEGVTHVIRQQGPRTSQPVQGGSSHQKLLKRDPLIQQAHNREE